MNNFILGVLKLAKEYKNNIVLSNIITSDYNYDDFRKYISEYVGDNNTNKKLIEYINKYGFQKNKGSGYVIHHFDNSRTHYFQCGKSKQQYKKYIDILKETITDENISKEVLQEQLKHIVLLPAWFHNYIKHVLETNNFKTREQFYEFMQTILLEKQSYDKIKALKFENKDIRSALKSALNLSTIYNKKNNENDEISNKIINKIQGLYLQIRDFMIKEIADKTKQP